MNNNEEQKQLLKVSMAPFTNGGTQGPVPRQ